MIDYTYIDESTPPMPLTLAEAIEAAQTSADVVGGEVF